VHGRKPGNERGKSAALQQRGEGGGFLVGQYLVYEYFHSLPYADQFQNMQEKVES
jgi:hypothetical protein